MTMGRVTSTAYITKTKCLKYLNGPNVGMASTPAVKETISCPEGSQLQGSHSLQYVALVPHSVSLKLLVVSSHW